MDIFIPITSVSIISPKTHGVKRSVGADIEANGSLVFSGLDWGDLPEDMLGGDYEYSATVSVEYKDSVLLLLIQERFADFPDFEAWLKEKQIPFASWRYS